MSSYAILRLVVGATFGLITAIVFFGGLKENKESFKKLNQHLDEKEKAEKPQVPSSENRHAGAH